MVWSVLKTVYVTATVTIILITPKKFNVNEFEDINGVIRIRKSKKDRQHNGQMKTDKRTNNNLQSTTQKKTKDREINYFIL